MAVCLQTSFLTPPVGFAIFYLKSVAPQEVKLIDIYKGVVPFVIIQLIGLALVFCFGQYLVLWLPQYVYGSRQMLGGTVLIEKKLQVLSSASVQ